MNKVNLLLSRDKDLDKLDGIELARLKLLICFGAIIKLIEGKFPRIPNGVPFNSFTMSYNEILLNSINTIYSLEFLRGITANLVLKFLLFN